MIAEIVNDLQQALLAGGALQSGGRLPAQQPVPGQAQERIVLRFRPEHITLLGYLGQAVALPGAAPVSRTTGG